MTDPSPPQHMVTRFAPSPTGRLHVGHAWSALMAHDMAWASGGALRLRIEDIDGGRSRPEHMAGILEDLAWLGLEWEGDVVFQSQRLQAYAQALDGLRAKGLIYPCFCTRADIQASLTAPHGPDAAIYPGTCRRLPPVERAARIEVGEPHAWRIDMARAAAMAGPLTWRSLPFPHNPNAEATPVTAHPTAHGDVVLARKDAPASYHLSCTIDDAAMGVTHILRGDDLRGATDIHRLLQALLDLPSPLYIHHPLLVGPDGKRLAKRDGSIALADLRAAGADPAELAAALRGNRFPVGITVASA